MKLALVSKCSGGQPRSRLSASLKSTTPRSPQPSLKKGALRPNLQHPGQMRYLGSLGNKSRCASQEQVRGGCLPVHQCSIQVVHRPACAVGQQVNKISWQLCQASHRLRSLFNCSLRLTRSNKSSPKQAQLSFGNVTGPGNRLKRRMWFVRNARQRSAVAKEAYSASMLDAEVSQRSARWSAQRTGGVMYNNNPFQINCFYYAFIFRPAHPNTAQHPSWIGCTIYALQGSNLPANAALRRSGPARLYCYAGFSHAIMCNACMNRFYAVVR